MNQCLSKVLFVDDDAMILQGYRRILRPLRTACEFGFAASGAIALELLAQQPFDIVISDMKMPEMDGSRLLGKIRQLYPGIARIALSGQSDNEMLMRSMLVAHQYLAKPCESSELIATIERIINLRAGCSNKEVLSSISKIALLPCLPETWEDLAGESLSQSPQLETMTKIVECDISLAAKVLQLANSAAIGTMRKVYSARKAVGALGMDRFRLMSAAAEALELPKELADEGVDCRKLWISSSQTAILARRIASDINASEDQVDLSESVGLLHDIGKLVFIEGFAHAYARTLNAIRVQGKSEIEAEKDVLGITHGQAGSILCGLWGLPREIESLIALHHEPQLVPDTLSAVALAVHVAAYLQNKVHGSLSASAPHRLDSEFLEKKGCLSLLPKWETLARECK